MAQGTRQELVEFWWRVVVALGMSELQPVKTAKAIDYVCQKLELPANVYDAVFIVSFRACAVVGDIVIDEQKIGMHGVCMMSCAGA